MQTKRLKSVDDAFTQIHTCTSCGKEKRRSLWYGQKPFIKYVCASCGANNIDERYADRLRR